MTKDVLPVCTLLSSVFRVYYRKLNLDSDGRAFTRTRKIVVMHTPGPIRTTVLSP